MKQRDAHRVCELVAGLIATDGGLVPAEVKFLGRVFEAFGIGDEETVVTPVVHGAGAAKAMSELSEDVRGEAMNLLLDAAVADGKVTEAEHHYLQAVAEAIETPQEEIEACLAERLQKLEQKA